MGGDLIRLERDRSLACQRFPRQCMNLSEVKLIDSIFYEFFNFSTRAYD